MIQTEERLVPELRFPEFEGEWEYSELELVTEKISVGIATEVRPHISYTQDVPLLRNQNIRKGFFDDIEMEFVTAKFDEANKSKRVKTGDILVAT